ncbi:maleylacetate reductase [Deinococcus sp.]|uniref:maleylacetate reductase n=1 Tax=Deinococcus sp. TaxID=47478 RepID=UPI0025BADFDC|nr:maleylacetate reductase [Deinococcus sp.]
MFFTYEPLPTRVVFGAGSREQLAAETGRLGIRRALVLSTAGQSAKAGELAAQLGHLCAGTFSGATMHTPVSVTEEALRRVQELGADGLVAFGGGSTTGLSKALALRTDLPQLILPTTYAGSEMTPILGETQEGRKTTQNTPKVLPETVIYDVELTLTLPPAMSASSGMNAVAHAAEALYAQDGNPVVSLMAEDAIRALAGALPVIVQEPQNLEARMQALYGAWLAGSVLGSVGMALHHKLAHVLGGSFNLPHAELHAALLPHTIAYNAPHAPEAMRRIARALGTEDAALGLYELNRTLGNALALHELGMPEDGIAQAAAQALEKPYPNPAPLEEKALLKLLRRAWSGQTPSSQTPEEKR